MPNDTYYYYVTMKDLQKENEQLKESTTFLNSSIQWLEKENKQLKEKAKNPDITSLWGKPMGYWIELEKSISSWEYPSGLAWHNWQLKMDNEGLQKSLTEAINTNIEMRRELLDLREWKNKALRYYGEIVKLKHELAELKQKLLELGGCPNAKS